MAQGVTNFAPKEARVRVIKTARHTSPSRMSVDQPKMRPFPYFPNLLHDFFEVAVPDDLGRMIAVEINLRYPPRRDVALKLVYHGGAPICFNVCVAHEYQSRDC
jgi:hypothetical protein